MRKSNNIDEGIKAALNELLTKSSGKRSAYSPPSRQPVRDDNKYGRNSTKEGSKFPSLKATRKKLLDIIAVNFKISLKKFRFITMLLIVICPF